MPNYAVGHNLPGYLPESDVWVTDDFAHAKAMLIEDLKRAEDHHGMGDNEDSAEECCHAAEDVNLWSSPGTLYAANLAWWIVETDEPVTDPDE